MPASLPSIVQSNAVATSVNSPASITASLSVASTAGNTLLLAVTATGATPTVSTPAGWTLIGSSGNASIVIALFALPNNAGGITTVAVTLNNATNGGAVATMFEVANMPAVLALENTTSNNSTSNQFPKITTLQQIVDVNEFCLYSVGFVSTTTGTVPTGDYGPIVSPGTSTVATTNVTLANRTAISGVMTPSDPNIASGVAPAVGINLNAAVAIAEIQARFLSLASSPIARGVGGGILVGTAGNPAGPLQVPQPQGQGQYSGTTGSF